MSIPADNHPYIDTSVAAAFLIPAIAHPEARVRFRDTRRADRTVIYRSEILRLEFGEFWLRLPRTSYLDPETTRRFRIGAWGRHALGRSQWMEEGAYRLDRFLARFEEVIERPFTRDPWRSSLDIMAQRRLRSHDALHVATALAAGVPDFATVDADVRRVPALRLHLPRDPEITPRS